MGTTLKAGIIALNPKNPRTRMDPQEYQDLKESISANGLISPILIRPLNDGYQCIAGNSRLTACVELYGEDFDIDVLIREADDDEAERLALVENVDRANMSPADEAQAAAKELAKCNGDHEETARRMGWRVDILKRRLALMQASDKVREALILRKISLGHAELLAAAPKAKQDSVLAKMLEMEKMPTVEELKASLMRTTKQLSEAIFDRGDCAQCSHNSTLQRALFSNAIDTGFCTSPSCYDQKTETELEARRHALHDEFPRIEIVRPGDNFRVIPIRVDGPTGVGAEQAQACASCANFGAAVSAVPDKLGQVFRDMCFDPACNSQKVAKRIDAEKAEQAARESSTSENSAGGEQPSDGEDDASQNTGTPAVKKARASASALSGAVVSYREKTWRKVLAASVKTNPERGQLLLLGMAAAGYLRDLDSSKISKAITTMAGGESAEPAFSVAGFAECAQRIDVNQRYMLINVMVATAADNTEISRVKEMLKFLEVNLASYWKIDAEFLGLLTKSEIGVLAAEIGLDAILGDKLKKLMGEKKPDLIKGFLDADGFSFEGVIPKVMLPE